MVKCTMGEKGNLLDKGEEIFANLAQQGPEFWIAYEQYKLDRAIAERAQAGGPGAEQAGPRQQAAEKDNPPAGA